MSVRARMLALLAEMENPSPVASIEQMIDWPPSAASALRTVQAPRKEGFRKGAKQRYSGGAKDYFQIPKDGTDN